MSPNSSVALAADQVPAVVDALLAAYAVAADALHHAVTGYLDGTLDERELADHRRRLGECEEALERLGWARGPRLAGGELVGPPALVGDVLTAAVVEAAEHVAASCRRYDTGTADLAAVQAAVAELTERHRVFAEHERDAS